MGEKDPALEALISWSHSEIGWTAEQNQQRELDVIRLTDYLRTNGVDAIVDAHQPGGSADWTRWGPQKVASSDRILIVASIAWRNAWEDTGNSSLGTGAAAEADALKSLYRMSRETFLQHVRLLILPGTDPEAIPIGLDGVEHYEIKSIDAKGLEPLLRDLTNQPKFVPAPLGPIPSMQQSISETPIFAEKKGNDGSPSYEPLTEPVDVAWVPRTLTSGRFTEAHVVVTAIPLPTIKFSERHLANLADSAGHDFATTGQLGALSQLEIVQTPNSLIIRNSVHTGFLKDVRPASLRGVAIVSAGQISAWHTLPADRLGSVIDEDSAQSAVVACLRLIAAIGDLSRGRIALAAEIQPNMLLSEGSASQLGPSRTAARVHLSDGEDLRFTPGETLAGTDLVKYPEQIAKDLAKLLLVRFRGY